MSANRDERSGSRKGSSPRFRFWQASLWGLSVVAAALIGAGTAMTAGTSHPMLELPGVCPPGQLKGALHGVPRMVVAVDEEMNVQGFYMPGGTLGKPTEPAGVTVDVSMIKHGSATTYCYVVNGVERCVRY